MYSKMNNQHKYIYKVYMKREDHSVHCERRTIIWANDDWVYIKVPGAHDLLKLSIYPNISKTVKDAIERGNTHLYKWNNEQFIFMSYVFSNEDYEPEKIKSYFTEILDNNWTTARDEKLLALSKDLKRQMENVKEIQSKIVATGCLVEFQFDPFRIVVTDPLRVNPTTKEAHKWTIDFKN